MADASVLKEFLVSLGFKVNGEKFKALEKGVEKATRVVEALGAGAAAMAVAVDVAVVKVADRLEELYFASQRINASAENIKAYEYALTNLGGSAQATRSSLEGVAEFMRTNPAGEGFLAGLGVQTRAANGQLLKTDQIFAGLEKRFHAMNANGQYWLARQYASMLGIDDRTLKAMILDNGAMEDSYRRMARESGVDLDAATSQAHGFMVALRELQGRMELIGVVVMSRMAGPVKFLVGLLSDLTKGVLVLDRFTDGVSTNIGVVVALIGTITAAVGAVMGVLGGGGGMVAGIVGAFTALAGLISAPVALIVAAIAGIGIIGFELYKHWDQVAHGLAGVWDRIVATFHAGLARLPAGARHVLGLGDGGAPPAPSTSPGTPGASGGSRVRQAIAYFRGQGWTSTAVAAIVGNLLGENDTLDPNRRERRGKGWGPGYGIAQWTSKDRKAGFARFAGHDLEHSTLQEQLAYLQYELTKGGERAAGAALGRARSLSEAVGVMVNGYERPKADLREATTKARFRNAQGLMSDRRYGLNGPAVMMHQKTDIHIAATDPARAGREVAAAQGQVNSDMVRNLRPALG